MDPRYCAQDVVRCTLCKTEVAPMYCNVCHTHLCKNCVVKHFSDTSKVHNVVPLEQFLFSINYPKCSEHPTKECELHCKQCDVPICTSCITSEKHRGHKAMGICEDFETKKEAFIRDLQELETLIFPRYQEFAVNIQTQKFVEHEHFKKLRTDLKKHGEALHKEIDTIIQRKQSKIEEMATQHMRAIDKQEDAINHIISEIKQVILDLKKLLHTSDVCLASKYTSRNEEFKKMPHKVEVFLPNFQPQEINREQLLKQLVGSLSPLSIEEEHGYILTSPGAEISPPDRPLLDVPLIITELNAGFYGLYGVACMSDEQIWARGGDKMLKLFNLQGDLLKSVQTKTGGWPEDIAVYRNANLVYTDYDDRSINLVSNTKITLWGWRSDTQIQSLIRLQEWRPRGVCSTSSGDLLVIMDSDDGKQSKVVRYSGSTEKQSIQWDDQGNPLYSPIHTKYLTENKNLDICVADNDARAVIVVSLAGKLRFRYTSSSSVTKEPFCPRGITTDSQGRILIADYNNNSIHVIDLNGRFLSYIENCGLQRPWGLCVDSKDNLFVAETFAGNVKKIQINTPHV